MRVYDMIVDQRLRLADLADSLTPEQLATPSLCAGWTVHDVVAHLTTYLVGGQAKIYGGIATMGADFDRLNRVLTARAARRPAAELAEKLRRRAGARTTIPFSGYDPVLSDAVLHELDIRRPLGLPTAIPAERLGVSFGHVAGAPSPGYAVGDRFEGLRFEATDADLAVGTGGRVVRGPLEPLLLAAGGRAVALDELEGDGLPLLHVRLTAPRAAASPVVRMSRVLNVILHPPGRERRSRQAEALPL